MEGGPPTSYVEMYQAHLGIPARPILPFWAELKFSAGKIGPIGGFWGSNLSQTLPGQGLCVLWDSRLAITPTPLFPA